MYDDAEIYEKTIDWTSRLAREIPFINTVIDCHAGKGTLDVLDLGCGTGHHLDALASAHPRHRFHGVDIDEGMVQTASTRLTSHDNVHVARGDLVEQPAFPGKKFDVIYAMANTMALVWGCGNLDAVFEALARSLHPGGSLLFHVLNCEVPRRGHVVSPVVTLASGKEAFTTKRFDPACIAGTMQVDFITFSRAPGDPAFSVQVQPASWRLHPWDTLRGVMVRHGFTRIDARAGYGTMLFDPASSMDLVCHARARRDVHVLCDGKG